MIKSDKAKCSWNSHTGRQVCGALALALSMCAILFLPWGIQAMEVRQGSAHEDHEDHASGFKPKIEQWEGSPEGIAYSEFNHALSGVAVILIGLSELRTGLGLATMAWARFLLPLGMLGFGGYLLIWSDHEAWPIGSLTLVETFLGGDWEIIQHKMLSLLLLIVGSIELLGRIGRIQRQGWQMTLPGLAILGGFLLFIHRHGFHPAAHQIMIHHSIMGILAIAAGSCRFASEFVFARKNLQSNGRSPLIICWATLILIIGVQLLMYSET